MNSLTKQPAWQALSRHQADIANQSMRDWFLQDPNRSSSFALQVGGIHLDYSRNIITSQSLTLLENLVNSVNLKDKTNALFAGLPINTTENRAVLHTALRDKSNCPLIVNGENIADQIKNTQDAMLAFTASIHNGHWVGVTGKRIKHIVNLGIGGSCTGPKMATEALKDFAISPLSFHFISSVDKAEINDVLAQIDPEATLFIVSSKTFTTLETLTNTETVLEWMRSKISHNVLANHFIAITAASEKAMAFGIPKANIFPFWDWVGGRYSIWSAIGLPLMLQLGSKQFNEFLNGAYTMDEHFKSAPTLENMPVLLALLSVWYVNIFQTKAQAIIPYSYRLRHFVSYLQQAEMESNGKCVTNAGNPIDYPTCPIIFGEEGCNGQHTYHQLLHQGQHLVPCDFILLDHATEANDKHHAIMQASGLSQSSALMRGKSENESFKELLIAGLSEADAARLAPHKMIPGNRPSNILRLKELNPYNLGSLIALYEHKVFVSGVIWDINSFDQWGVELGKQLLPDILKNIQTTSSQPETEIG
jgi:glucose-6-phosphate isomerase